MIPRYFVVVMLAGACGTVDDKSTTYKGSLDQTPPKMFGGGTYCTYNITLKQLAVEIDILPSKHVSAGRVQELNVESVVVTTPPCPFGPAGPTISSFTFDSATPSAGGMTLTFQGAPANTPVASLVVELSSAGAAYQAQLTFVRTDLPPPLAWSVVTTVPLTTTPTTTP